MLNKGKPQKSLQKDGKIKDMKKANHKNIGLIYVFVIDGKIFKIGQTINSIKERLSSYNCGKLEYRLKGTCSTTNFFVLQSL